METGEIINAIIIFLFAAGTLAIYILQFFEKGFPFNNTDFEDQVSLIDIIDQGVEKFITTISESLSIQNQI